MSPSTLRSFQSPALASDVASLALGRLQFYEAKQRLSRAPSWGPPRLLSREPAPLYYLREQISPTFSAVCMWGGTQAQVELS